MKRKSGRSRLFLAALGALLFMPSVKAQPADQALDNEIDTILTRYRAYYLEPDYPDEETILHSQKPDGSWADVDYDNRDVAAWSPAKHIDRVKRLASAYVKPNSPFYHSAKMLAGVEKGLTFWYARKPKSDNWWHNQIGQQLQLERILVLLHNDLPPDLMQSGLTYFMDLSKPSKATGENLVWFAGEYLTHGLLTRNETEIRTSIQIIQDTIVITDKEGIQVDYAFHQHGPQLYNGGYGYGFLQDSSMVASFVAGTRFAFAQDKIDLLSAYLLDGCRWMMRGPMFDYGANGRGLVRKGGPPPKGAALPGAYCDQLAKLNPGHKDDYEALKATLRGTGTAWTILGNKQFYSSDFMVDQTKDVYFSVKMNSSRTVGIETINGENLKGYWLPFGLTYIAPTGKEYDGIFPVWDWAHLPGVTSPAVVYQIKNNFKQPNSFVGGVSDGTHGACAMKLDIESPGESLHAQKAWFFFDHEIVALGSGISSTLGDPVDTTLNQTLLKGPVVVDGKKIDEGEHELKGVSWVLHAGIGYLFPAKTDVVVHNATQTGSWQSISSSESPDPVSEKVFSLWVNHGVKPADGTYAYIVVPGMDQAKLAKVAEKIPVQILANTTDQQAARNDSLAISQVIFYHPGQITLRPGLTLQVDQPCLVQVTESKGSAKVVLASPASGGQVNVTLGGKQATFDLPVGPSAGSSQIKDIPLS
jgi:chondroitin AC lyase